MRTRSLAGVLIALLLMAGAATARAQEVTQAEKDKALQYLARTAGPWHKSWNTSPRRKTLSAGC